MPPHGYALACRFQVGLVCDCVLVVTQLIAGVSEQLDQRYTQVSFVSLGPVRHQRGNEIDQGLTEAGVVFGKVVNDRLCKQLRRADFTWSTIKSRGAACLKPKRNFDVCRIELLACY